MPAKKSTEKKAAPSTLYTICETSNELETDGIIIEYGSARITIARSGGANRKFASVMEKAMRPYRAAINAGTLDEGTAQKLMIEAYADAVIIGWEGVTDREGNDLPFTKKNVVKVMTDLPDLFLDVKTQAERVANFTLAGAYEDAKS